MVVLFPKKKINILLPLALLVCIFVLIYRLPAMPLLLMLTFGIVIIFLLGLIYRILCLRKLVMVSNNVLIVHSYFKHKRYHSKDIDKIVINRGGWAYQILDIRIVRIKIVSGKEDILLLPDFIIKDFDKILLSVMRTSRS